MERSRPEGTAEALPTELREERNYEIRGIQLSLRDGWHLAIGPTLERVGYSQFSLREKAEECPEQHEP